MILLLLPIFSITWRSQVLQEELDGCLERAFLAGLDLRVAQITTDSKTVRAAIPVRPLVPDRKLASAEDFVSNRLRLLGELLVNLAAVDQKGCLRLSPVFLQVGGNLQTRGVGDDGRVALVLEGEVERGRRAKAVSRRTEARHTLLLQRADDLVDDVLPRGVRVLREPGAKVKVAAIQLLVCDRVADENVGHDDLEAVPRKVVRKEPVVDEGDTEDIGEVEDHFVLGVVDGGRRDITLDAGDLLNFAFGRALMTDTADAVLAETHGEVTE